MSGQQHVCFLFGFFLFSPFAPQSSTIFANGGDGETVRRPGGPALAEAQAPPSSAGRSLGRAQLDGLQCCSRGRILEDAGVGKGAADLSFSLPCRLRAQQDSKDHKLLLRRGQKVVST